MASAFWGVRVAIVKVGPVYVGLISVPDPSAHLSTTAIVATTSLSGTAGGGVTGTAAGISSGRPYLLQFTI